MKIFRNIVLYALTHALVDAACVAVIFSIPNISRLDAAWPALLVILYDVLAFSLQPIMGFMADRFRSPAKAAAAGCILTAFAAIFIKWPAAAVCLSGLGNALFHVGGGAICLNLKRNSAGFAGLYVAPGAMGLFIGTQIGKGGHFAAWVFVSMLIIAAICIIVIKHPEIEYNTVRSTYYGHFTVIIILLLTSVAIRALVGLAIDFPWKTDMFLLKGVTVSVVLGKAVGGILADRIGWIKTAVVGLVISAPLLSFGAGNPYIAMMGVFMFNLTMPVTLVAVSGMFPCNTGFAFGLTALGLIAGSLPVFTGLKPLLGRNYIIFSIILFSALMLYAGLKLYLRGEIMEGKKGVKLIKSIVMLCICLLLPYKAAYAIDVASPGVLVLGIGALVIFGFIIVVVIIACIFLIRWIVKKNANK